MGIKWPAADDAAARRGESYHQGAAYCRRGHGITQHIKPTEPANVPDKCTRCGARVLSACGFCNLRIRGKHYSPMVLSVTAADRPSFCDGCGGAYPWATREERVFELENLLDEEEIDDADRVVVQDHLARLRSETLSEKEERQAWAAIKERGGEALKSGAVQRVLEGLVSAAIRSQVGL